MKLSVVLVAAALAFSSCNCFKKMAKNRDDINLTVTPEILTLNNGIVAADINVTFPVKYFNAKAVIKVTPVIVFEGGEVAGAAKYLQGSKVDENYTVVDKKNGGSYTQHVEFPYDPRMDKCALQLRAEIKCPGGKCKEFTLVNLNTGAIPTKEQAAVLGRQRRGCQGRSGQGIRPDRRLRSEHPAEGPQIFGPDGSDGQQLQEGAHRS